MLIQTRVTGRKGRQRAKLYEAYNVFTILIYICITFTFILFFIYFLQNVIFETKAKNNAKNDPGSAVLEPKSKRTRYWFKVGPTCAPKFDLKSHMVVLVTNSAPIFISELDALLQPTLLIFLRELLFMPCCYARHNIPSLKSLPQIYRQWAWPPVAETGLRHVVDFLKITNKQCLQT